MNAMRGWLVHSLLFLSLLAFGAVEAFGSRVALAPGDVAPKLQGTLSDGTIVNFDFSLHKLTLVNFWASWCEPCKAEMPELQRLWEQRQEQGFEIVGVFQDTAGADVMKRFADELGVIYPVIRPRKSVKVLWGGGGVLPVSYLINGDGKIVRRYVGATPAQVEGLRHDVGELLEGRQMGPLVMPEEAAVADSPAPVPQQGE